MSVIWKEKVFRKFDSNAHEYDKHTDVQKRIAERLAQDLPNQANRILEIGCGSGHLTRHLIEHYPNSLIRITDISPSMVKQTSSRYEGNSINFDVMDGESPDTEEKYDLIVSNMVVQWFADRDNSLQKLAKLLNPGGCILFTMPGSESFKEWRQNLVSLKLPIGLLDFGAPKGIYHEEYYTQNYASAMNFLKTMKSAGVSQARDGYKPLSPPDLKRSCAAFDATYKGNISWHILFGRIDAAEKP
ncbi:MAG: methyltransferase domain-containing protein [Alphaproteobacteria bacterium]|nr:methyltransferase domain-containing protein [Alphaproteobacteria bacterium]